MLDPWIIEEIRRKEEDERRRREERPFLEIPREPTPPAGHENQPEEDEPRGVTIVDFHV